MKALTFHAGPLALVQIGAQGLRAQDIAIVPAAAGGPKGLIFQALDQWMFGEWLPGAPRERARGPRVRQCYVWRYCGSSKNRLCPDSGHRRAEPYPDPAFGAEYAA